MNETRRTLLKGMLASSIAGAAGLPQLSFAAYQATPRPMALMLTGTPLDAMILDGARAAVAESGVSLRSLVVPTRAGIIDTAALGNLLQANRGLRVAGVTDDAGYVLLSAVARDTGVALLVEGRHSVHGGLGQTVSRHEIHTASGLHGVVERLAAGLAQGEESFAVAGVPIGNTAAFTGRDWSAHGFDSYRVNADSPLCLHLAGLPLASACAALDFTMTQVEPVVRFAGRQVEATFAGTWPSLLGYALCRGGDAPPGHASAQVFLRGDAVLGQPEKRASVVSFVIDL